ncbi:MAG: S8 family serine peptidase [Prevotella sp.]|nr:S8 family serine peptidase [Prevotella sp.]
MKQDNLRIYLTLLLTVVVAAVSGSRRGEQGLIGYPGGKCYMYRLTLRDKVGTSLSLAQPERFLSKKAIARRRRQGIAVDSTDLPVSPVYIRQIEAEGVQVVAVSKWNNTVLVRDRELSHLENLATLPFVVGHQKVFTSPDSIRPLSRRVRYQPDLQVLDTTIHDYYGVGKAQIESLNGRRLHDHGLTGKGMTIAVLDAGFMNVDKIPAFKDVNILGTRNFVAGYDDDVYKQMDHGTKTLSAIATNRPSVFVGTAPRAGFWLLRCEDYLTESSAEEDFWIAAAEFADSVGVDIISSSLGYHGFDDKLTSYHYADLDGRTAPISRAAARLAHKGIVLVNSAGNDGMGPWKKINVPADAPDILTVGAIAPDSINAAFSSIGPAADGRVKPDVMAYGCPTSVVSGRGYITQDTGTSFACPLVAGMVACLWQGLPGRTALEIIDIVRRAGNNARTPDNIMGYGIPDFWAAYQQHVAENRN